MTSLTQWAWFEQAQEMVKDRKPGVLQSLGSQVVGHSVVTEQLQQAIKHSPQLRTGKLDSTI